MIRKSTLLALFILLALVGISLFLQRQKSAELAATPTPGSTSPLFSTGYPEPSTLRVENAAGDAVEIARDAQGKWVLEAPSKVEADQASAEAAATQARALSTLAVVRLAPAVVGLDKPAYTLTLTFNDASVHTLLVGAVTPIQDGYYTQLDKGSLQVVDKSGLDAIIGLLKAPPYQATPTPLASPTTAPVATSPSEVSPTATLAP